MIRPSIPACLLVALLGFSFVRAAGPPAPLPAPPAPPPAPSATPPVPSPPAPAPPPPVPAPSLLPRVDFAHLPWADGESLTYLVSYVGAVKAAQGTFVARKTATGWLFKLSLNSCGVVDTFYPFSATFWSIASAPNWRSIEYGEYRFEPKRTIKERTQIDYTKSQGTREMWAADKTTVFPIAEDAVDDIGTMLYHIRALPWKPGDKRTLFVYESDSEKQCDAVCEAIEKRAFGTWPAQPLLSIVMLPGKGTHHKGRLAIWMTDDARRLPLHADIDFRYGSFSIDLLKAGTAPPASH